MNKNDLISAVSDSSGISKADATKAVDSVFSNITGSLQSGNEVRLVGFGTFSVAQRKATTGRNPRTGERIYSSEKTSVAFKMAKELKNKINKNEGKIN